MKLDHATFLKCFSSLVTILSVLVGALGIAVAEQQMSIWSRVKRDLLVEGSAVSHWTWHISTRGYCSHFAAVAPKQYLDYHKIADELKFYNSNFMSAQLGWTGFLTSAPDYPATLPDEIEHNAVRMLELNVPVSLETSFAAFKGNGRTDEIFQLLGEYEQLRLSDMVSGAIRDKLRTGEWHKSKPGSRQEFLPVRYDVQQVDSAGEVKVKNDFTAQKFKFRLQAGPGLAKVGDRANIPLLSPDTPPGTEGARAKPGHARGFSRANRFIEVACHAGRDRHGPG